MSLLVIVPTRKRPHLVNQFIDSFEATVDDAELLFVTDGDDDSYEGFDWRGHGVATIDPRATVVAKLNKAALEVADQYDYIMHLGDDCVFVTPGWDTKLIGHIKAMGGSGWVYPNNKRRSDVPESWMVSTDLLREMGWFLNPLLNHYYVDNVIAELGKRTSLIRYARDVVIEHRHYSVTQDTAYDEVYRECEQLFGQADLVTWKSWSGSNQVAALVSRLRRKFNPDVQWVLGKVLCVPLLMGQWTVPTGTNATLTLPTGSYSLVLYNTSNVTIYMGTGNNVSATNGLQMHSVPTAFNGYQGEAGAQLWTYSGTATTFNYVLSYQM